VGPTVVVGIQPGARVAQQPRQPKSSSDHAALREADVARLDVAVNDAGEMELLEDAGRRTPGGRASASDGRSSERR
jgi:hypothetical protein